MKFFFLILVLLTVTTAKAAAQGENLIISPDADLTTIARSLAKLRADVIAGIPQREISAPSGSEFMQRTRGMKIEAREAAILKETLSGNIPDYLRQVKPIYLNHEVNGTHYKAIVWVLVDYLAIGSSADFVRIPADPVTAQKVADYYGFLLPTTKLVDEIYMQADVQLLPKTLPTNPNMITNDYFLWHHREIEKRLEGSSYKTSLIAGHKKDVVITNRLTLPLRKVAVYGWHLRHGSPIQYLTTWHDRTYTDYSHGIRLVGKQMYLNGRIVPVMEIMQDKDLAPILSYEGVITDPRIYSPEGRKNLQEFSIDAVQP